MSRITVEDCLNQVPSRFELVMLASKRARQLFKGAKPLVESDNRRESKKETARILTGFCSALPFFKKPTQLTVFAGEFFERRLKISRQTCSSIVGR